MTIPKHFKISDLGGEIADVQNAQGSPLFRPVTINWSEPRLWKPDEAAPTDLAEEAPGYLYVLVRNHHKAKKKDTIAYVGITNNLKSRFKEHPKAHELVAKQGQTSLSIGNINFGNYWTAITHNRRAIEELEHILIWSLWETLYNEKKLFTLPGMGTHPGRAWHIKNEGHRFSGRMPREIVFPWILIKPGRDRSAKGEQ